MENVTMNYESTEEEGKNDGLDTKSVSEMTENIENDVDTEALNEVSESSEPIKEDSSCMITEEDMNQEIEKITQMNFIELMMYQRTLKKSKQEIVQARAMVEQLLQTEKQLHTIDSDTKEDDLGSKLALSNAEDKVEIPKDDIDHFIANYDISISRLDTTMEACNKRLEEFNETKKTSSFMNQSMLDYLNKKEESLINANSEKSKKALLIYYRNMKEIYSNRESVDYILDAIPEQEILIRRWVKAVKNDTRQKKDITIKSTQKKVGTTFCSVFSVDQMKSFEAYLKKIFSDDFENEDEKDNSVFIMQYVLYLIYTNTKARSRGLHKWVEALIINVVDILADNYDLPNGVEYYNEQLRKVRNAIMEIAPKL